MKKITTEASYDAEDAREALRQWVVEYSGGCEVQSGKVCGKMSVAGWPCGTCFIALLNSLGLDGSSKEYHEHNDDYDRVNEVWRALLEIREGGGKS